MHDPPIIIEKFPTEEISYSNLRTIFAIWNTMIGTGTFIIPYLFSKSGLIPGIITLTVLYLINMYTCIIVASNSKYASDFTDVVYRYGNNGLKIIWVNCSFVVAFLVSWVYAIIMSQTTYTLVGFIINVKPLVPGDLDFN
mmetsp:Transcript_51156/g.43038  ORF Transcript_51156/g.43038 Transcript_51156/m.43038 type:complete len:140 (-) Transcript_51156:774-1193(-)